MQPSDPDFAMRALDGCFHILPNSAIRLHWVQLLEVSEEYGSEHSPPRRAEAGRHFFRLRRPPGNPARNSRVSPLLRGQAGADGSHGGEGVFGRARETRRKRRSAAAALVFSDRQRMAGVSQAPGRTSRPPANHALPKNAPHSSPNARKRGTLIRADLRSSGSASTSVD